MNLFVSSWKSIANSLKSPNQFDEMEKFVILFEVYVYVYAYIVL